MGSEMLVTCSIQSLFPIFGSNYCAAFFELLSPLYQLLLPQIISPYKYYPSTHQYLFALLSTSHRHNNSSTGLINLNTLLFALKLSRNPYSAIVRWCTFSIYNSFAILRNYKPSYHSYKLLSQPHLQYSMYECSADTSTDTSTDSTDTISFSTLQGDIQCDYWN